MSLDLTILYDGDSDALRAHRLSVREFAKPLRLLLTAVQRTASGIVRQATDEGYGERGGRLADVAKQLDIEISSLEGGCVQLHASLVHTVPIGATPELPGLDLSEATLVRLLDDIQAESQGQYRNAAVRRYLKALPKFLTHQSYVAKRGGSVVREVSVNAMAIAAPSAPSAKLTRISGTVSAVGLEAGRESVTIKSDGQRFTFWATAPLVERALSLRDGAVVATGVAGVEGDKRQRLLRLDLGGADLAGDPAERLTFLANRWSVALEALAK